MLFLIYINDVLQNLENVNILLYADDTVIYSTGKNLDNIVPYLQNGLNSYAKWSSSNKLTMNEKKTKLMFFASSIKYNRVRLNNINIAVNGTALHFVPTYKYLGVILDYELTYNAHVRDLKKRLAFKSYLLGKLKQYVPTPILLTIYKNLCSPCN